MQPTPDKGKKKGGGGVRRRETNKYSNTTKSARPYAYLHMYIHNRLMDFSELELEGEKKIKGAGDNERTNWAHGGCFFENRQNKWRQCHE